MGIKRGQIVELSIDDIAFGGRGLAKVDGMVLFVDQAVPGDRVMARVVKKKKRFAEARVVELLHPSPHRIQPPCPYSGYCGGCKWQFLKYEKQLEYKARHVAESLEHIALIPDVPVYPTLPSDPVFGYRNKMEFSCSDRRWLLPAEMAAGETDPGFALGLHVPGTFHKVLDTRACLLQPDFGNILLGEVRDYMQTSGVPPYGLKSHEGFWRFLMLRHSVAHDHWMVNLITAAEDRAVVEPLARRLVQTHPRVVSVVNNITARKAGIAVGEREILLAGDPTIRDRIGPYEFEISANSFFQTNSRGAARLYGKVKEAVALTGRETVVDLYSGTGTIPIWLSEQAQTVIGLEIVESAVADAQKNCRRNGVDNCRFVLGDIRETIGRIDKTPEIMIIDPPRDGMHKDVVREVLAKAPGRIVYVSCNPATLARDLLLLKEKYRVEDVQPIDMFPHTFHVEAVARLTLR